MKDKPLHDRPHSRSRPTMREIADRLGVHKSTVSRVLSGQGASRASPETAAAIRSMAEELGYRINPWAASLRTQRTRTIGVLLPRLTDIVLSTMFEAIDDAATAAGYQALVASTGDDAWEQRRRVSLLESRHVDGFVITTAHRGDEEYLDGLARGGIRFVLANRAVGRHPVIRGDDWDGGMRATDHLLRTGHRRIGVIAGRSFATSAADRTQGYVDALTRAGVEIDPELVVESGSDLGDGEAAARHLLALDRPPTAIFAVNDFLAIGAMSAIRDARLRIGTDVAVVGYNDIPLASRLPVPLSSVHHPVREIGQIAVRQLLALLEGEPAESVTLPVALRVRASSQRESSSLSRSGGGSGAQ